MQLSTRIEAIKTAFEAAFPSVPFNLQLAPQSDAVPSCVLPIGQIEQVRSTTVKKSWVCTFTIQAKYSSDTAAIAGLDSIVSLFDRSKSQYWWSMLVTSASVDADYLNVGSLWKVSITLVVEWTT